MTPYRLLDAWVALKRDGRAAHIVSSLICNGEVASTLCRRSYPVTALDVVFNPIDRCKLCERRRPKVTP